MLVPLRVFFLLSQAQWERPKDRERKRRDWQMMTADEHEMSSALIKGPLKLNKQNPYSEPFQQIK